LCISFPSLLTSIFLPISDRLICLHRTLSFDFLSHSQFLWITSRCLLVNRLQTQTKLLRYFHVWSVIITKLQWIFFVKHKLTHTPIVVVNIINVVVSFIQHLRLLLLLILSHTLWRTIYALIKGLRESPIFIPSTCLDNLILWNRWIIVNSCFSF